MNSTRSESLRRRALARAQTTARATPPAPSPQGGRSTSAPAQGNPMPIDHGVAGIASRYLRDGYQPTEVAQRLGIDHGWCRQMTTRLRGGE